MIKSIELISDLGFGQVDVYDWDFSYITIDQITQYERWSSC